MKYMLKMKPDEKLKGYLNSNFGMHDTIFKNREEACASLMDLLNDFSDMFNVSIRKTNEDEFMVHFMYKDEGTCKFDTTGHLTVLIETYDNT